MKLENIQEIADLIETTNKTMQRIRQLINPEEIQPTIVKVINTDKYKVVKKDIKIDQMNTVLYWQEEDKDEYTFEVFPGDDGGLFARCKEHSMLIAETDTYEVLYKALIQLVKFHKEETTND